MAVMNKKEKEHFIAKLKALRPYSGEPIAPTVFEREGNIFVSAEDGGWFADYYGEYRGGRPWIHPELVDIAKDYDGYWEWENPGCIIFSEN